MTRPESGATAWSIRRLLADDAALFRDVRLEGVARHPNEFRIHPDDERLLPLREFADRLERSFVVGGFDASGLAGIAGLARFEGIKVRHRAILWGMYVTERARGAGLADALMAALLAEARRLEIEQVLLTVAAGNDRARRLYERWRFVVYATDVRAIRIGDVYGDELLMACTLD